MAWDCPRGILHHSLKLLSYLPFEAVPINNLNKFYRIERKVFSLASKKLWLSVSIALDRPINIVPTYLPSSAPCLHFLAIFNMAFCLLWFLRNPIKNGKKIDLKRKVHLIADYFFKYPGSLGKDNNSAIIFFT